MQHRSTEIELGREERRARPGLDSRLAERAEQETQCDQRAPAALLDQNLRRDRDDPGVQER